MTSRDKRPSKNVVSSKADALSRTREDALVGSIHLRFVPFLPKITGHKQPAISLLEKYGPEFFVSAMALAVNGKLNAKSKEQEELELSFRAGLEQMLRKSRGLRSLLDFSKPNPISARMIRKLRWRYRYATYAMIQRSSPSTQEAHARFEAWATSHLPSRGRPPRVAEQFVMTIDAIRTQLHRQGLRRHGSAKPAIVKYLRLCLGRQPTAMEVARAQVTYSRRTRRTARK